MLAFGTLRADLASFPLLFASDEALLVYMEASFFTREDSEETDETESESHAHTGG